MVMSNNTGYWNGWFYLSLLNGIQHLNISSNDSICNHHSFLYQQHLKNLTLWAVQMFDSSAVTASGFISGDTYHMGHFDECISVAVPEESILGKYCLASLQFQPDAHIYPNFYKDPVNIFAEPSFNASIWEKLKVPLDPRKFRRDVLQWAICVPASCSNEDIESSLQDALSSSFQKSGIEINLTLGTNMCYSTDEIEHFDKGFFIILGIILAALVFAIVATFLDLLLYYNEESKQSTYGTYIKMFSLQQNCRNLIKPYSHKQQDLKMFNFLKVVGSIVVIQGHRLMYMTGIQGQNTEYFIEKIINDFSTIVTLNGIVAVDVFFIISGFLLCLSVCNMLEKRISISIPLLILMKFFRVIPTYAVVIALHTFILQHLGDGPLWKLLVGRVVSRCQQSWWINLLFVNNYVNVEHQCILQAWYLSCDMHFFIIGTFLIYITWRWKRTGIVLLNLALLSSIAIPSYVIYVNRYIGFLKAYHRLAEDPPKDEHYREIYIPSHMRATPYVIGIILSFIYQYLKKREFKFSSKTILLVTPGAFAVACATIVTAWIFYLDRPYYPLEHALYAGLHRVTWALSIGWFILAEATTSFGPWFSLFRHNLWIPFGRLTYCVFLIHTFPQIILFGSVRQSENYSIFKIASSTWGDVILAYSFGLVLHLLIESPASHLQKHILSQILTDKTKSSSFKNKTEDKCNGEIKPKWVPKNEV